MKIYTDTHTYSPTQRYNMHNTSFEGSITHLHKQHTVLEKEIKSKSTRKGVVYWVLPRSIFKNKKLAVVKEDGFLPDLFPLFIPFAAKEFVLLMQFLQRRVLQRDSANQKCPSSSSLLHLSMHGKSEFLLTLFAQPQIFCVTGMDRTIGERSFQYIGPVVWNALPLCQAFIFTQESLSQN